MKIMYLQCGLGNQMFQWAFLRYLQQNGHSGLRIDASSRSLNEHWGFELYRVFPAVKAGKLLIPRWIGFLLRRVASVARNHFGHSFETAGEGPDQTMCLYRADG